MLPANAYWGAQTARSCQNAVKLPQFHPRFLEALLLLNKAAAAVNVECGLLDAPIGRTIGEAVDETLAGQWRDQFVVSLIQPGSLFDVIVNVREVLANRAGEILGARPGSYSIVHPHKHVGLGRTSHADFHCGLRLSLVLLQKDLEAALRDLERLLRRKALEFERQVRSCNQESNSSRAASLGQLFNTFGFEVSKDCKRISVSTEIFNELSLQFDGIEQGITKNPAHLVINKLSAYTEQKLRVCEDCGTIIQSVNNFLELSAALRLLAGTLHRIADQVLDLATGHQNVCPELVLPTVHFRVPEDSISASSSPVIPDFVCAVAYEVTGMDTASNLAGQVLQPEKTGSVGLIAHNLLQSLNLLQQTVVLFNTRCLGGITAHPLSFNSERLKEPADAV